MVAYNKHKPAGYKYLEKRLFEYIALTLFFLAGYFAIQTAINTENYKVALVELLLSLGGISFYLLSQRGYFKPVRIVYVIMLIAILIYLWFATGGYEGNMSIAAPMIGIMLISIGPKTYKLHLFALSILTILILTYIQITTDYVSPIPVNEPIRSVNYVVLVFVTLFITYRVKYHYDNDRKLLFEQNDKLEELNTELEKTIHQLNKTKDQLVQSEKMASIGRMTAGIAHELNNPLNYVSGGIRPIQDNLTDIKEALSQKSKINPTPHFEEIELLLNNMTFGTEKIAHVIANLVKISPKSDFSKYRTFNLSSALNEELIRFIQQNSDIEVYMSLQDNVQVKGHILEFIQMFNHLLDNALDATEPLENPFLSVSLYQEGERAILEITNNGEPINEVTAAKIFEPFFSTKQSEKHLGLGLYFVYNMVKKHNGNIQYIQKEGRPCFQLSFHSPRVALKTPESLQ